MRPTNLETKFSVDGLSPSVSFSLVQTKFLGSPYTGKIKMVIKCIFIRFVCCKN